MGLARSCCSRRGWTRAPFACLCRLRRPCSSLTDPFCSRAKQAILEQQHAEPRCDRIIVATDLGEDDWPQALITAGFDKAAPAVLIAEGLSWYLTEDENARLLDNLARLAAAGSRLGIDMVSRDFLENPAVLAFFEFTAAHGIRWQFATNDPAGFLAAHGWRAEVTDFDAVARRLGRWPPPGVTEEVAARATAASGSYFISAQRATPET